MLPINLNFLNLHNYEGVYFLIAILCALAYFTYLCKQNNIDVDKMYEALFISLISALFFGRLFSLVFWSWDDFIKNPIVLFMPWKGGITVIGAVIGGLFTGFIYAMVKKLSFFYHIRFFIPSILVGQIVGRFGCFLNGDASGGPTNMPWGIVFHPESVAYSIYPPGTPLHPSQLYEIIGNLIILVFLIFTEKNEFITSRRIIWYLIGYGIIRYITEIFRSDTAQGFFGMTSAQVIGISCVLAGIIIFIITLIKPNILEVKESMIARPIKK